MSPQRIGQTRKMCHKVRKTMVFVAISAAALSGCTSNEPGPLGATQEVRVGKLAFRVPKDWLIARTACPYPTTPTVIVLDASENEMCPPPKVPVASTFVYVTPDSSPRASQWNRAATAGISVSGHSERMGFVLPDSDRLTAVLRATDIGLTLAIVTSNQPLAEAIIKSSRIH